MQCCHWVKSENFFLRIKTWDTFWSTEGNRFIQFMEKYQLEQEVGGAHLKHIYQHGDDFEFITSFIMGDYISASLEVEHEDPTWNNFSLRLCREDDGCIKMVKQSFFMNEREAEQNAIRFYPTSVPELRQLFSSNLKCLVAFENFSEIPDVQRLVEGGECTEDGKE
jgi:hypothetical protein